jgi:hypothetical protein
MVVEQQAQFSIPAGHRFYPLFLSSAALLQLSALDFVTLPLQALLIPAG